MNENTAGTIICLAIIIFTAYALYITESLWCLLILFFLPSWESGEE